MCPMTVEEGSFPDMAITSTLMADPIPTTSGQETGITQLIREVPVVVAAAVVHVRVLAPVLEVAVPAAARKTLMELLPVGAKG